MGSYFLNFTVYTLAMCGLVFFALYVYKKVMNGSFQSKEHKLLSIEETMSINPRKSLMIVKAGEERFLIASDIDKTSLISKLENKNSNFMSNNVDVSPVTDEADILNLHREKKDEEVCVNENNFEKIKPLHLEIIKDKNPSGRTVESLNPEFISLNKNMVDISVGESVNHGFPTMKEMAKKINEL